MGKLLMAAIILAPCTGHAALDLTTMRYLCERGVEVPVNYVNDGDAEGIVSLVVDGRLIALYREQSDAGARYAWPSDGSGYVWQTEGDSATLLWKDGETATETPILTQCKVAA